MYACPICQCQSVPVTEFGTGKLVARVCAECGEAINVAHAGWVERKYGADPEEDSDG